MGHRPRVEHLTYIDTVVSINGMNILIDLPDHVLPWLERRQKMEGITSRRKAIIASVMEWSGAPRVSDLPAPPRAPKASDSWPVNKVYGACPECKRGQHCHNYGHLMMEDDNSLKHERTEWYCNCAACKPEGSAHA